MKIFTLLQNLLKMLTGQTSRNLPFNTPNVQRPTPNAQRATPNPVLHSNKSVQLVNASDQNLMAQLNDASVSFEYKILPVQKKIIPVQNIKPVFMQNFFAIVKKIFSLSDHPRTLLENLNDGYHPGCHYGTAGRENISRINQHHDVANLAASFALIPIALTPTTMNHSEKKPVKTITGRSGIFGVIMLMSMLFFVQIGYGQITQPSAWTKAYDQASGTGNTVSFPIASGSNRILIVGVTTSSTGSNTVGDPTITYGGVTLTQATGDGAQSQRMHTWLYFLKDNAVMNATSQPIVVTTGSGTIVNMTTWYSVFAGVNQAPSTYTIGNGFTNTSGSGPASLSAPMTINANEQAVYISSIYNAVNTTIPGYTINTNWTSGGNNTGTSGSVAWKDEVANRAIPGSNTTDNAATSAITPSNDIRWAISAMSLPKVPVTYTSITNGNWNSNATWDLGSVPTAGSNVVIANGTTVTLTANTNTINSLTVNGTLDVSTFTLAGTGTNTVSSTGTLSVGGTTNFPSGFATTTVSSGSTVNYYSAGAQTISGQTYGNLTLSGGGVKTLQTGTTAITGNLTLSGTATTTTVVGLTIGGNLNIGDGTTFTAAGFALTVTGTTSVGAGTSGNLTITSATGTKIFTGLVTINTGGTWTNTSANSPVTFRGGITNNGTFNSGTGVQSFVTNPQTLTGTFSIPSVTVTGINLTNSNTLTVATTLNGTGTLTNSATGILNIGGTISVTTLTATAVGNAVNYTATGGGQAIKPTTYSVLNMNNTGGTNTVTGGNLIVTGALTTTAGGILNMGTNTLNVAAVTNGGTITTQNTSATPISPNLVWGGTIIYNANTGGQTIVAGTYTTLTMSNTSGTQSASGNIVTTTLNNSNSSAILDLGVNTLSATTVNNSGTIRTQNTSANPLPSGLTWGGTVNYNANTGVQTVVPGTYGILTMGNTSGTQTAAGNIITTALNNANAGSTLDMGTNTLTLTSVSNTGTIQTENTGATPFSSGITWGGTVFYNGSAAQTVVAGTYNNLKIPNSGGASLGGAVNVGGILTLANGIINTTSSNLLSITNTSNTAISGASATAYINGPLSWNISTGPTYTFPVGNSGSGYLPFALVNPTVGSGTVTAVAQAFNGPTGGFPDGSINTLSTSEYWSLNTTGNFTSAAIALTNPNGIGTFNGVARSASLGGTYTSLGGSIAGNTITSLANATGSGFFVMANLASATLATGTITGSPFCVSATIGANVSVPFISTGTFAPSNVYTAQLSDATGSFSGTVTVIGNITSGLNSGTINAVIPAGTVSSPNYLIRVVSSNPALTGTDNGSPLVVNPAPQVNASVTSQTSCTLGPIAPITISDLNSVPGTTFTWTRDNNLPPVGSDIGLSGSGTTISGTLTNSNTSVQSTVFTITATTDATPTGCTSVTTSTVFVNPPVTVNTISDKTYCAGSINSIALGSNVSGATFAWTSLVDFGAGFSGSNFNSFTATNPGNTAIIATVHVTATASSCTGPETTFTVTVNPTPSASALPASQTICTGTSITGTAISDIILSDLNSVSGTTFTWTRDNNIPFVTGDIALSGSGSTITGKLTNSTTTIKSTVFTIIATTPAGCTSTTTATVTVYPSVTVNAISNSELCVGSTGSSISFGSNIPAATFAWTSSADIGFGLGGNGNIPSFTAVNPTSSPVIATISVKATDPISTCSGPAMTFTITVNPAISNNTISSPSTAVCTGSIPATITGSIPSGGNGTFTYQWQNSTNGVNFTNITTNGTSQNYSPPALNQNTWYRRIANSDGCTNATSAFVEITINPLPQISSFVFSSTCTGSVSVTAVTSSGTGPFTIVYSGNTGGGTQTATGVVSGTPFLVQVQPTSNTTYTVSSITDANGCVRTSGFTDNTTTVTLTAQPQTSGFTGNTVCIGGQGTLTFTRSSTANPNPFTIIYTDGTNNFTANNVTSGTAFNVSSNPTSPTTYTLVSVTDGNSCSRTSGFTVPTATITVNPAIANNSVSAAQTICSGTAPATLTGSAPIGGNGTFTYQWQSSTNGTTFNNIGGATSINFSPGSLTGSIFYQRIVSSGGCTSTSAPIQITVNPAPAVTNSATATICTGLSPNITLTANIASSFAWTVGTVNGVTGATSGSGPVIDQILTNPSTTSAGTVQYIVTPTTTTGTGCVGAPFTITVTVNPAPSISSLTATPPAICIGTSSILNVSSTAIPFARTIVNYSFNGTNPLTTPDILASNITSTITPITGSNSITVGGGGYASGSGAFTTNSVGGNALLQPTNNSMTFTLGGSDLPKYKTFRIYFQATRLLGGGTVNMTVSYSLNGAAATTSGIIGTNPQSDNTVNPPVEFLLTLPATVDNPTNTLAIIVAFSGASTNSILDNFEVQAVGPGINNYSWTSTPSGVTGGLPGTAGTPSTSNSSISVNPTVNTSYVVKAINSAGCFTTGNVSVNVNPLPTATISGSGTYCNNNPTPTQISVALTGTAPWSVTYTDGTTPVTVNNIASSPYTFNVSPTVTTTYSVTAVSDASCTGTGSGSAVVTVNTAPNAVISGTPTPICSGSTTTLSVALAGTAPFSFDYFDGTTTFPVSGVGGSGVFTVGSPFVYTLTVTPPANTTPDPVAVSYTITSVNDANGCSGGTFSGTGTVNVNPLPTGAITLLNGDFDPTSSESICSGDPVFLRVTVPTAAANGYQFTYSDGVNSPVLGPNPPYLGTVILTLNPLATGSTVIYNYSLLNVTDLSSGCVSTSAQLSGTSSLTVNPLPTATISVDNATVCINGTMPTITFTGADGTAPYTFTYSVNGGAPITIATEVSGSTITIPVSTSDAGTFTYTLISVKDASTTQCQQTITGQQVSILVRPSTAITSDVTSPAAVCVGGTAPVLSVTGSGAILTYQWYINNSNSNSGGTQVTNGSGGMTADFTPDVSIPGTYYYYVIVSGECGSATSSVATVEVTASASVESVTGTSPLCIGATATYTANSVVLGGGTASWSSDNILVATVDAGTGLVTAIGEGTANIIYTISGGCNGTATAQQSVTVLPNASVASVTGTSPLCIGATATYTANSVVLGGGTASWSSDNILVATVDAGTGLVTAVGAGTANIIYTITGGCNGTPSAQQSITVTPNASVASVTGTSPLCIGATATYIANSVVLGGGTASWSSDNILVATVDAGTGLVTAIGAGTANIIYTISGGCNGTATAQQSVTVLPNASVESVTGTSPLCIGATATYTANSAVLGGGTASWSSDNILVATVDASTGLVTAIGAGTANIIYTISGGCNGSATAQQSVTVLPGASVASVTGTSPLCIGATATYTANSAVLGGGTASWSSDNILVATVDAGTGLVTAVGAGTANIIYTISGGCNGSATAQQSVTVIPSASVASVTGTSPLCIGATATYTANSVVLGGGTANWSSDNILVATVDASTGLVTAIGAGTANIIYTISGGCNGTATAQQSLTVLPNASVESVTGTSPLCIGATATYTANSVVLAGGTASWSSDNILVATVDASTGLVTAIGAGTANIIYTISGGCNGSATAQQSVTVLPNASVASVTGTSPLCIGATATYTANSAVLGGGTASWSSDNILVATVNASTGLVTAVGAGTANIIYTISSGCNGSATAQQSVTVIPSASVASVTGTSPLCIGATTTYTANSVVLAGGTASWSSDNILVATVDASTGLVTAIGAGTANIIYTISGGCNGTATAQQSLIVLPNASVASVTGTSPLCIGATATYTANSVVLGGGTASWSSDNILVATVNASTGLVTAVGTGTANIIYTISGGCNGTATAQQSITVTPNASVASVTGTSPLCIGATATYTANSVVLGGGTASWSSDNILVATVNASTGLVTAVGAGTANIIYTISGGCNGTATAQQSITVTPNASVASVTGTSPLCIGATATYTANSVVLGGGTASWSSDNILVATVNASTGLVTAIGAGTANIIYTISGGCNGTATAQQSVTVLPNASVASVTGTSPLCIGGTATYTANSVVLGGGTASWSSDNILVATVNASTGLVTAVGAGTANIIYTISGGCNGTATAQQSVTVNLNTSISSNPSGYSLCAGASATALSVTASGTGTLHYAWFSNTTNSNSGGTATGTDAATFTPNVSTAGTTYYYVTVTSDCGPATSTVAAVTVNPIPTITSINKTDVKCFGNSNGTVTVNVNGGTPGYNYTLSSTTTSFTSSNTTGLFTGLAADTYNVLVTDSKLCSPATGSITVGHPDVLAAIASPTNITCFNMNNGTALITVSGGTGAYHYSIDGNATVGGDNSISKTFMGLFPGPHTVVITDDNLCSTSVSFNLTQPTQITAVASAGTVSCNNSTTQLFVFASGGTGTLMYSLNGGLPQTGFVFTVGAGGPYTVTVTDANSCSATTTPLSIANASQMTINITGVTPSGCSGATGSFNVSASGGAGSYTYSLNGGTYQPSGSFTGLAANTYLVTAKDGNGCTVSGIITITASSGPTVFNVTGGGSSCTGAAFPIGLSNAQAGVTYFLLLNGVTQGPGVTSLPGFPFTFGNMTAAGTYTVVGFNPSTGCQTPMSGSAIISSGTPPTAFTVTGGGSYCSGAGLPIGLSESQNGVSYQLLLNGTITGAPINGNGSAISFGNQTAVGTYTVVATNATNCTNNMSNPVSITGGSLPTPFTVTSGPDNCTGLGVHIGLGASQLNVNYQLYLNGAIDGAVAPIAGGNGSSIDFGLQPSGTYTVVATTTAGCTANMTGSVTVNSSSMPIAYSVTGGGSYCTGGLGLHVGLQNSESGVNYQVFNGAIASSGLFPGSTGSQIDFGLFQAGTYTVKATNATGCIIGMTGSATIALTPTPTTFNLIAPNGLNDCTGLGVDIQLSGSESGVSYQLYLNGIAMGSLIPGTGSPIDLGKKPSGIYTIVGTSNTGGCIGNTSNSITVNSGTAPTAYTVTGGGNFCSGPGLPIGLSNSETGVNYTLILNNTTNVGFASGTTGNGITFGNQSVNGSYSVLATNTVTNCTNTMLNNVIISAGSAPTAFNVGGGGSYCSNALGVKVTLSSSEANVNYQLLLNGGNIGAALVGNGSPLDFGFQTAGTYTVFATNALTGCTRTMNGSAIISVNNAVPTIITQPLASQTICVGNGVTFSVAASVDATGYQWLKNSSPITGANGSSYTILSVSPSDQATYSVIVSGTCGNVTSNGAALIVNAAVAINTQPVSQSYCGSVVLSVGASNATGYQWKLGGNNIIGATNSMYTATGVGSYTVDVSGPCGATITSNAAVLTTPAPVSINTQPQSQTFTGSVLLSVGASNAIGYQWYFGGNPIPGANNTTYTATAAGSYYVIATGLCGSQATSATAVLSTCASVTINTQPLTQTFCGSVTLSVSASNATGYQWQLGGNNIIGANNPTYLATAAGSYTVVVSGPCGTPVTSNPAILTANASVTITTQPVNISICTGGSATFSVTASNASGYQWFRNNNSIPGAINATYTTGIAGNYKVVVSGGCGSPVTSNTVTLTVNAGVTIVTQPVSTQMCAGGTESFSVVATNATGYQWYRNSNLIIGATSAQYFTSSTGTYDVRVFDACGGSVMSNFATLTINPPVAITSQPQSQAICSGGTATFTVGTINANGFQWYRSNAAIPGATQTSYTTGVAGNYKVVVTGGCGGPITSNVATLSFLPPPPVAGINGTGTICAGTIVRFTDATPGGTWSSSNTSVATVSATGFVRGVSAGTATIRYTVGNGCTTNTATRNITVNSVPDVQAITGNSSVCPGSTIVLSDGTPNGDWSSSNTTIATVNNNGRVRGIRNGNVTISYTVQNSCGSTTVSTPIAVSCSSIQKNSLGATTLNADELTLNVSVSPNPSQNFFTLIAQSSVLDAPVTISIFDMQNRLVDKHTAGVGEAVRFGDRFAAGMYIIQVTQGGLQKTVKVVKN